MSTQNYAARVRELEQREAARSSTTIPNARRAIARRLKVSPGTLESLIRGRLKGLREEIAHRLRGLVIHELEAEIERLEHELSIARTIGTYADADQIDAAHAALEQARKLLGTS